MIYSACEIGTKIGASLSYYGALGTIRAVLRRVLRPILEDQRVIDFRERLFDRRFGLDTAGIIPREDLKIDGPSARYAIHYQPVPPTLFKATVAALRINYSEYSFLDFGCGKGKALLLASSFPFKKITGVELSPELANIATVNLQKYKSRRRRCAALEVVCMDAVAFPIPRGPIVCFFYNPFGEEIMARVLENLEESVRQNPRDLIIVYFYPEAEALLQKNSFWVSMRRRAWGSVYRANGPVGWQRPFGRRPKSFSGSADQRGR